uniref:Small MutS related domain-containing family protein n=1 Tax=Rhizophora mucronata TaxID=61149 RepID=A0A2P2MBX3_RHIMU
MISPLTSKSWMMKSPRDLGGFL